MRVKFTIALLVALSSTAVVAPASASGIAWAPCDGPGLTGLDCATLALPMDYTTPSGAQITVAISRHRATSAHRRGILFTNPGGPGEDGLSMPNNYASQPVAAVYDIIGMDPRGLGRSTKLSCLISSWQPDLVSRPSEEDLAVFAAAARDTEENCRRGGGAYRRYVTTMNTARDMDRIRAALGEPKLSYLGVSYGTWLGAVYGAMFPQRMDRSVLDSALDPNKTWHQQDVDVNDAIERNFDAWAAWAANRDGVFHLGATSKAVRASVDKVADALPGKPIAGFTSVTEFDESVGEFVRYRPAWKDFGDKMRQAVSEVDGAAPDKAQAEDTRRALTTMAVARDAVKPTGSGVYQAVTCEWEWPANLEGYYADMRRARDHFPYGGTVGYMAPTNCSFRSFTPEPLVKIGAAKYPAGLVLQGDGDTQTPYPNGEAMAETLGSALISVRGEGTHGQYANTPSQSDDFAAPNPCVDDKVNAYLVNGVLPGSRVSCASTNPPADVPFDPPVA